MLTISFLQTLATSSRRELSHDKVWFGGMRSSRVRAALLPGLPVSISAAAAQAVERAVVADDDASAANLHESSRAVLHCGNYCT